MQEWEPILVYFLIYLWQGAWKMWEVHKTKLELVKLFCSIIFLLQLGKQVCKDKGQES